VWLLRSGVRQFCWVGQLSIRGCVVLLLVLLAESGRWEERRNDGNGGSGGVEGWRGEGFFFCYFFQAKRVKEGNLDPMFLQHLHFLF
jgi:hypothetical protein